MRMTRVHRHLSLASTGATLVLIALGTACSDQSPAPPRGSIQASVRVTGEPNGSTYTLIVDSLAQTFAFGTSPALIFGLSPGTHTLSLKVPAKNCTVTGL